jgi:hypothetical protein
MTVQDDAFLDSVAVFALGALPDAEARDVAAHLRDCPTCRAEYTELRSAANAVGYAAEARPGEIDDVTARRMKSNVMRAVRGDAVAPAAALPVAKRPAPWPYYAAAAALVAAILTGLQTISLRSANDAQNERIAADSREIASRTTALGVAEKRAADLDVRLGKIVAPGARHFAVANGEVIEANGKILIAFSRLAAPPAGKVYQAWTLTRGAKTVAPSITFAPDASGVTVIELPGSAANLAAVAVSVEPSGGSKTPTSTPTFVRALS